MKTTQGAAHNHIMSTTQVPRPRIEPKTKDERDLAREHNPEKNEAFLSYISLLLSFSTFMQDSQCTPCHCLMLLHSGRSYLAISTTSSCQPGAACNTSPPKLGHVINKHIVSSVFSLISSMCNLQFTLQLIKYLQ